MDEKEAALAHWDMLPDEVFFIIFLHLTPKV